MRARILVIDDLDFPYEQLFKDDGYNITKWNDVTRLNEIEQGQFDIILLDLHGIGTEVSADQGLGVLRHVKETRPSQVVIAYSNADWGVKYKSFFDRADGVLPKNADYADFKKLVDDLLLEHFSLGFHLDRIDRVLSEAGVELGWWGRRTIRKAIGRGDKEGLSTYLRRRGVAPEDVQLVASLAQVATGVAGLWTS